MKQKFKFNINYEYYERLNNVIGFVGPEELTEETAIEHEFKCYYEETEEFKQLYKCNKIIEESEPQYEVDENGRKFIDLNKLYKRFNPNQLYFNYIPSFEKKISNKKKM
ncbi:hypothetical protein Mgra_00004538 [Meloidogyne graminicola]|uniref:Uncharacterized protein n=1 Tax=Meloidogyne graminicola TaxID=189291 RepID=A0A8S9ZS98_9BILA|nr:hypothetical protein Mgra_00004538 [Meloidogyne graminicola]